MKILVLGGGVSPEREVSLRSAAAVAAAAKQAGYDVREVDPKNGFGFLSELDSQTIVFPIIHGKGGEDGLLQQKLEQQGIKFLGSGSVASQACFNKWTTRQVLEKKKINMPEGYLVTRKTYTTYPLSKKPHVLKTPEGGSSIGTYVVRNPKNIDQKKVDDIFNMDRHAVLEEYIKGVEITVPILAGKALPIIEIQPPPRGGFDYDNKYNGKTKELCPPESIDARVQEAASRLAEKVHKAMGAKHISRTDIIVGKDNELFVLEINTIPGMTDQSLYPKAAKHAGLDMPALIKRFVALSS